MDEFYNTMIYDFNGIELFSEMLLLSKIEIELNTSLIFLTFTISYGEDVFLKTESCTLNTPEYIRKKCQLQTFIQQITIYFNILSSVGQDRLGNREFLSGEETNFNCSTLIILFNILYNIIDLLHQMQATCIHTN